MAKDEYEEEEYEEEYEDEDEDEGMYDPMRDVDEQMHLLCGAMKKYSPTSQEYMVLCERLNAMADTKKSLECAANERTQKDVTEKNRNVGRAQVIGNVIGPIAAQFIGGLFNRGNVNKVVDCEQNGGIVKSSGMKFIK